LITGFCAMVCSVPPDLGPAVRHRADVLSLLKR